MATLYINFKARQDAQSADGVDKIALTAANAQGTKTSKYKTGGVVELLTDTAAKVSIGANPNALTDAGAFYVIPGIRSVVFIADGQKVAGCTA